MKRVSKVCFVVLVALVALLSFATIALAADGRIVQDDPDNPIKFSIDAAIANGSVSHFYGILHRHRRSQDDASRPVSLAPVFRAAALTPSPVRRLFFVIPASPRGVRIAPPPTHPDIKKMRAMREDSLKFGQRDNETGRILSTFRRTM